MTTLINMSLEKKIMQDLKEAMLKKDSLKMEVCRSIKSAILLSKTEKKSQDLTEDKEIEILQKLYKQRQESSKIYQEQNRLDLLKKEEDQASIILTYLPKPYTREELNDLIDSLIIELNINSMQEMGKLISSTIAKAKGRADGKTISSMVKEKLS